MSKKNTEPQDSSEALSSLEGLSIPEAHKISGVAAREIKKYSRQLPVHIIVDSCADLAPAVAALLKVEIIEFPYVMDGQDHLDDLWKSQTPHEFYEAMRAGSRATTAAVSPGRYYEIFEQAAKVGKPTLYLGFTRGLSSSIDAAMSAASMIAEAYPDFELYVLDNLCPSAAAQLLIVECVRLAGLGMSAKELYEWALDARYFVHGYFTIDNLQILAEGGRIPPAAANIGGKLDIKPELSYGLDGALTLRGMCRGRKKALRAILAEFKANHINDPSLPVGIVSADAEKDADWLESAIRKEPGCSDIVIIRSSVSPVIGSHVGPGMVALVFWGEDRRERVSLTDRIAARVRNTSNKDDE